MSDFAELSPPYSTIVADPPWPYRDGRALQMTDASWRGVEQTGYRFTSMPELVSMPVRSLAADDAHLYVWCTNAFIVEAHELARAWGFQPKTLLTWVKVKPDGTPSMKAGHWFRGATEHVVFAVRGTLPLQTDEAVPTAFLWPRVFQHSVKPPAFGDLVERCSPGPYLELFARAQRLGWDSWGHGYEIKESA